MSLTAEGKRAEPMEETLFFTLCVSLLFNIKTNKSKYIHSKGCVFTGSKEANYGKKRTNKKKL